MEGKKTGDAFLKFRGNWVLSINQHRQHFVPAKGNFQR